MLYDIKPHDRCRLIPPFTVLFLVVLLVDTAVHATQDISNSFSVRVNDARYDTTFKVLFGRNEKRVASFLNSILRPEPEEQITTVKFLDPNRVIDMLSKCRKLMCVIIQTDGFIMDLASW